MAILLKFPKEVKLEGDYIIFKPGVTEEEFWEISNEDSNYELIDGVLVIHSSASEEHEGIFNHLMTILSFYLNETKLGKVYGSRYVMRLSKKWNPEPDIMVVLPDNYHNIKKTRFEGPADLVIEILSKSTKESDLSKKLPYYLKSGVKEVWIIDPDLKIISLHTENNIKEWTDPKSNETIESSIIPHIPFEIRWIWNRESFSVSYIIKEIMK